MANPTLTAASIGTSYGASTFNRLELLTLRAYINGLSAEAISWQYGKITTHGIRALIERAIRTFHAHNKIDGAIALRTLRFDDDHSVHKAIWAINLLEKLAQPTPTLADPVSSWFLPVLARRLEQNGILTLEHLCHRLNEFGVGFYRQYPRLGAKAATALLQWIQARQSLLDYPFVDLVPPPTLPVVSDPITIQPGTLPVPLERVKIVPEFNGQHGKNRAAPHRNRLAADNDLAAIHTWLSLYKDQPHTYRAYRREAERLLLWCIIERATSLSDLTVEDCQAYKEFLADPRPSEKNLKASPTPQRNIWAGARAPRNNPRWRPFEGPLSPRSVAQALTILKSMFDWLSRQRYLDVNIFDALSRSNASTRILVERALPASAWHAFISWLSLQTEDHAMHVALVAALLAGDAGLRRHEIANLTRENLVFDEFWELRFTGKRNKDRSVPLSDRCVEAIRSYHLHHKQASLDALEAATPLLYPINRPTVNLEPTKPGYSSDSVWRILKLAFKRFSQENGPIEGKDLSLSYPHALRHTFGVQAVRAGIDLDVVSQCLGHSSLTTTTIYTQGDRRRRSHQLRKLHATP